MQILQAGEHKMLYLELDTGIVGDICKQMGLECEIRESKRALMVQANAPGRQAPLLLFDARDPGNLGWFARCQFYVDGHTANVLQTPISIANQKDPSGYVLPNAIRLQINKELPPSFRLPGRQPVSEQVVYSVFYNFLTALLNTGVALCGGSIVRPLAGRGESNGPRG
ncbi:MAG: hypothetical protein FJW31_08470 [Acidobacteria bacterium]|nr:hypothetical protein [Acidobacteriota bacterium]